MTSPDPMGILMQGGLPPVPIKNAGDRFDGVVVRVMDPFQQRSMDAKKELQFWDNEKTQPIWVVPIELQSDLDGKSYAIYIAASSDLQRVLAKAVRDAGGATIAPGGHVSVACIGFEPSSIKGGNDKRLHAAKYGLPPNAGQALLASSGPVVNSAPTTVAVDLTQPPASQAQNTTVPMQDDVRPAPDFAQPAPTTGGQINVADLPPDVQALMAQYQNGSK